MALRSPTSAGGISVRRANLLDARAAAGNPQARRRQAALVSVATEKGLPAKSATGAALMLQNNLDAKAALRTDIAEVREAIAQNQWPADVAVTNDQGEEVVVTLRSADEAKALLQALEERLQNASDLAQEWQLRLQDAMNKQAQAYQMLSAIMKAFHDTAKSIIQNMKA